MESTAVANVERISGVNMSEDRNRQIRIAWIKQKEILGNLSFLEIVNAYNATFGTNHFAEVLGNPLALPKTKRTAKELVQDAKDIFLGEEGFLGFS